MFEIEEADKAVRKMSDKARKSVRVGKQLIVPHKFKESGEAVTQENFNPKTDLSKLNQKHWQFLEIFQRNNWNMDEACKETGLAIDDVKKMYKKVQYFEFEANRQKALAAVLSPDFVTAKHVDNVFTNQLEDGQRDSLKELAKISGAYKPTTSVNINANIYQMPKMTPEQENELKIFADRMADIQEAQVVDQPSF